MMKNILYTLLFTLTSIFSFAQVDITPGILEWEMDGINSNELEILIDITNNTEEFAEVYWDFERGSDLPQNWTIFICDNNTCYEPNRLFGSNNPNTFEVGETRKWKFKVVNNQSLLSGYAHGILRLYSDVERTNLIAESSQPTTNTNDLALEDIVLFPNPTVDHFQVKNDNNVDKIRLFNIVGREVQEFEHRSGMIHDVSTLRTGMYLVRLENSNGEVIKAMRLSKR